MRVAHVERLFRICIFFFVVIFSDDALRVDGAVEIENAMRYVCVYVCFLFQISGFSRPGQSARAVTRRVLLRCDQRKTDNETNMNHSLHYTPTRTHHRARECAQRVYDARRSINPRDVMLTTTMRRGARRVRRVVTISHLHLHRPATFTTTSDAPSTTSSTTMHAQRQPSRTSWATDTELSAVNEAVRGERLMQARRATSGLGASASNVSTGVSSSSSSSSIAPWCRELRYDVAAFEAWFARRPLLVLRRALVVGLELGFVGASVAAKAGERRKRAKRFTETLTRLGPAYIKLGQVMSTRADVFPVEYVEELAKLQDALPPADLASSVETLERELGISVDFFESFDPRPVAAASLAQVYRATLPGGHDVAIKLQRPGLAELVALDAVILRRFVGVVGKWRNFKSDVVGIVDELVGRIFEEMDYTREADNCRRFRTMYAADGDAGVGLAGYVYAPRVVDSLSTPSVLTMEWVDGLRLTDLSLMQARGIVPNEVLDRGLRASLHQLLSSGFMHTDPHPGNLIVAENGGLTYLDFGMTVEVPVETRRAMVRGLIGFVNRDARGLVDDLQTMDFLPPHVDKVAAEEALRSVFAGESATKVRDSMDFMGVVSQLSTALMKHGFRLPPYFSRILRALAALEGTATTIDPSFRVVERSYPFVLSRVLSDRSPEMRESLRRLLLSDDGSIRYKRLIRLVRAYGVETTPLASGEESSSKSRRRECVDKLMLGISELFTGTKDAKDGESEARRATMVAMEDAVNFLLSDRGEATRTKLIEDAVSALESLLDEKRSADGGGVSDDDSLTLYSALSAVKSTTSALADNPDLWIPVIGRAAIKPETASALCHSAGVAKSRLEILKSNRRAIGATPSTDVKELLRRVVHELTAPPKPPP